MKKSNGLFMKNRESDMNKIDSGAVRAHQLRIDCVARTALGDFWNDIPLPGGFWRLYVHDAAGAGVRFPNGRRLELEPRIPYLLPPFSELRSWRNASPEQLYIHFEVPSLQPVPELRIQRVEPTSEISTRIDALFRTPLEELYSLRPSLIAAALVAESLLQLPAEAVRERAIDRRIAAACDRLRNHPAETPDNAELAYRAGLSVTGFLQRFREATGCTPARYRQIMRYEFAARLLESGDLSIEEICAEIGINDRFHFSRTFKSIYGEPPAAYRKTRRG